MVGCSKQVVKSDGCNSIFTVIVQQLYAAALASAAAVPMLPRQRHPSQAALTICNHL